MRKRNRKAFTSGLYCLIGLVMIGCFAASTTWEIVTAGIIVIVASVLIWWFERPNA